MKNTHPLVVLLILLIATASYCQKEQYSALKIPDSLKTNANAVVREHVIDVTIASVSSLIIQERRVITVLNELGNRYLNLYKHYDNDSKINRLSVKIYDAFGHEIKKISKQKFIDVSAVANGTLYSDSRKKYAEYTPTTYPYTVVFESETQNSSTGFLTPWYPIENYYVSVEKSTYTLTNSASIPIRVKEVNLEHFAITKHSKPNTFIYALTNQVAQKYEQSSVAFQEIMPYTSFALDRFALNGVLGSASNWEEFGRWMDTMLLQGRTQLSEATVSEVRNLVKDARNDIEKAKRIYNFVQNKTRYIGVQVGIGGWQPISADEVDKLGYGDCKGLTNYTKALLEAVGITSYHTIVYAERRRDIDSVFSSLEGNHMILNIPREDQDIWLECTSQTAPFGFLGDFTDDRNVLVITPDGGVIKRTPAYKNEYNLQTTKAMVTLTSLGHLSGQFERISKGTQYNEKSRLDLKTPEELSTYYKSAVWDYNNNLDVKDITLINDKDSIVLSEKMAVTIDNYGSIVGDDYLFRLNMFNRYSYIPKRYRNRALPLLVNRGFLDKDEYTIVLPKAYKLDVLPAPVRLETQFGIYHVSVEKINDATLLYKKYFLLKAGKYPKEAYKAYRKFLKRIAKYENLRISIQKK